MLKVACVKARVVRKTVKPKGFVGSNPTASAFLKCKNKLYIILLILLYFCYIYIGMRKNVIDISDDIKRKEVYNLFLSFKNRSEAHRYFGISDNKSGSLYLNEIANLIGFDINSYKYNKKKVCLNCGKEINSKFGKKFCSKSCSAYFNNSNRYNCVYKKISNTLKNNCSKNKIVEQDLKQEKTEKLKNNNNTHNNHIVRKCVFCCSEYTTNSNSNSKYCSNNCVTKHRHKIAYDDFLNNNEKYCRGNYTPKAFKKEFMLEQNNKCAICGCDPEHNGKPLVFVLDHIDGDASNNKRENLRMVCPNCDSQLDTFKSKNKNSSRRNYWKEKILRDIS